MNISIFTYDLSMLVNIPGREKCRLQEFFKIKEKFFLSLIQEILERTYYRRRYQDVAIYLGALPVFYLALSKLGIIKMKTAEEVLSLVASIQSDFNKTYAERLEIFKFLNKLGQQASLLAQSCQPVGSSLKSLRENSSNV